jgi:hypothetical protein
MIITITAFERSPDRGRGLARGMRVAGCLKKWASLEPAHLALHPFGQIQPMKKAISPCSSRGRSRSIIAERHAGLLPEDTKALARAIAWMFAALSTVEPPIVDSDIVTDADATRADARGACAWSRIASVTGLANSPLALATPTDPTAPLARPTF